MLHEIAQKNFLDVVFWAILKLWGACATPFLTPPPQKKFFSRFWGKPHPNLKGTFEYRIFANLWIRLICIHTYLYIHTYIRTYVPTYLHMYLRTYIPTYLRTRTYVHMYLRTYVPMYLCTYVPMYLRTYVPMYLRTYVPTYIHTYIHTYIVLIMHIVGSITEKFSAIPPPSDHYFW